MQNLLPSFFVRASNQHRSCRTTAKGNILPLHAMITRFQRCPRSCLSCGIIWRLLINIDGLQLSAHQCPYSTRITWNGLHIDSAYSTGACWSRKYNLRAKFAECIQKVKYFKWGKGPSPHQCVSLEFWYMALNMDIDMGTLAYQQRTASHGTMTRQRPRYNLEPQRRLELVTLWLRERRCDQLS